MHKIILGVTGGIAAYKSADLARLFVRKGYEVQVIMTEAAAEFVTPLTFQVLTGRPAYVVMYGPKGTERVRHIELAQGAGAFVVAPATANTIAKMAHGVADNLLTTTYLSIQCPVVVVPSMNVNMFEHPAVRDNIGLLCSRGCHVMEPDSGELACGVYGKGRMPEPQDIYHFTRAVMSKKDYQGIKALVTAGPTREFLDPVRFISNPSSGLMGYTLARALSERGADVTLISGPSMLVSPLGVDRINITTAAEMHKAVIDNFNDKSLIIKAAAVSDFRPCKTAPEKVKKEDAEEAVLLERTVDILHELGQQKGNRFLVGFAAETEDLEKNAREKMERKNLDMIVINNIKAPDAGFACETNRVNIIDRDGRVEEVPLMSKEELSHRILDHILLLTGKQ